MSTDDESHPGNEDSSSPISDDEASIASSVDSLADLRAEITKAIENGLLDELKDLLTARNAIEIELTYCLPDDNDLVTENITPLMLAALFGQNDIVRMLLDSGANIRAATAWDGTAVHLAARSGHTTTLQILLAQDDGSLVDLQTEEEQETALHIASKFGRYDACETLLIIGASIEAKTNGGCTPIMGAAQGGHEEVAKILIDRGADVNCPSNTAFTALHLAAYHNRPSLITLLLDGGADRTKRTEAGHTPFLCACLKGSQETVQLLFEPSCLQQRSKTGQTCLHNATQNPDHSVFDWLLEQGADLWEQDNDDCSTFFYAAQNKRSDLIQRILAKGADANQKNRDGRTALHFAAMYGDEATMKVLLDNRADIYQEDKDNNTPFHLACMIGNMETVQLLLGKEATGLHITKLNKFSNSPLHLASENGDRDLVGLLLSGGADIEQTDANQATAAHLAAHLGNHLALQMLLEHGADINKPDYFGDTPLHRACATGETQCVELLIKFKVEIDRKNFKGFTALSRACSEPNPDVVRALLDAGADPTVQTVFDRTPFHLACMAKHHAVATLLLEHRDSMGRPIDTTLNDSKGITALCWAANSEDLEVMLGILTSSSSFPDDPIKAGNLKPEAFPEIIEPVLLKHFGELLKSRDTIPSVMFWAILNGRLDLVMRCVKDAPAVVAWSRRSATWIHIAAQYGQSTIMLNLLPHIDSATASDDGTTALHLAAANGNRDIVDNLLDDLKPDAASTTNVPDAKSLVEAMAITRKNSKADSPLSLAVSGRHMQVEEKMWTILQTFGAKNGEFMASHPSQASDLIESVAELEKPGQEKVLQHLLQQWFPSPSPEHGQWTVLHWAVYHSQAVIVWWLLSKGAHLGAEEIAIALDIVQRRKDEASILIKDLLKNPPQILEHLVNLDDQHPPSLPAPLMEDEEALELLGTIVDVCTIGNNVNIQYTHRTMRDIIYNFGPKEVMAEANNLNHRELDVLKQKLRKSQTIKPSHTSPNPGRVDPVSGAGISHEPKLSQSDQQQGNPPKGSNDSPSKGTGGTLKFRWLHIPANNMQLTRNLVTRLARDADKTEKDHRSLANFLNRSWALVAAGGGKDYMKPQCLRQYMRGQHVLDSEIPAASIRTALYMPYLTLGKVPIKTDNDQRQDDNTPSKAYESLMDRTSHRITHEPMTLDQYHYAAIDDTKNRDNSQVISRYIKRQNVNGDEKKILIIDQLWLWIVDEKTIITTTTKPRDGGDDILLKSVVDNLIFGESRGHFERPTSVDSMMELIIGIATGLFMHKTDVASNQKLKGPLEVFRESIRDVTNAEIELFNDFLQHLHNETKGLGPQSDDSPLQIMSREMPHNPYHVISRETELLNEIKDIRDELNILRTLAEDQETVWKQVFHTEHLERRSNFRYNHACTPSEVKKEVEDLVIEAEMTHNSINTLLDLRQKQATITEAEFGRLQANDTARQSNTIIVFTIVTIIFLPLSFLTSLFALDISNFPHEGGDLKYRGWWIFPILFGVAAIVVIPAIYLAFNVNSIINKFQFQKHRHGQQKSPSNDITNSRRNLMGSVMQNHPARKVGVQTATGSSQPLLRRIFPRRNHGMQHPGDKC